jgi:peroxiredoxin
MKWITTLAIAMSAGAPLFAAPPVPRPAHEFTIVQPSGKQSLLSSYRGDVVLVQFLYTTCSHCQAAARTYSKLQTELGSQGFRVLGVAFNPEVQGRPEVVDNFVKSNALGFPVGTASIDTVLSYLGVSIADRFMVPQIMIVDREGMIRAQSDTAGSAELQDETFLRPFLSSLLKESKTKESGHLKSAHPAKTVAP